MLTKMKMLIAAGTLAMAGSASSAIAAPFVVTGDDSGSAVYNRPIGRTPVTQLSGTGTAVHYAPISFFVDTDGAYTLSALSTFDNELFLYDGVFTPSSPLTNAIAGNDDANGLNAQITATLSANTNYTAVLTSFLNSGAGAFSVTFNGPGAITLGSATSAVPEPATWAMMILGMGAIGFAMRSAKRRSDEKFDAKIKRITEGAVA